MGDFRHSAAALVLATAMNVLRSVVSGLRLRSNRRHDTHCKVVEMPQQQREHAVVRSWLRPMLLTGVGVVGGVGAWYGLTGQAAPITEEGHVVEVTQAALWGLSALVALLGSVRQTVRVDRLFTVWLAVVSSLVLMRELDLHVVLNQLFSVRFKTRWLLDPGVPFWLKATWLGLGAGLVVALVVPLWCLWKPLKGLLCRGDVVTGLLAVAAGCLGMGYILDDLLGRGQVLHQVHSQIIEETCELLGALAFCAGNVVNGRWPLSTRVQALGLCDKPQ